MSDPDLRSRQEPLKAEYETNPDAARITLTATGDEADDARSCSVDIGRAVYEAQLHEGAGGPGTGACSDDLLLGALAACSQLTAQAVAENLGADVDISVEAAGDLDLRGTMGVDEDVPVGFQDVRLDVTVEGDVDEGGPSGRPRSGTVSSTGRSSTRRGSRRTGPSRRAVPTHRSPVSVAGGSSRPAARSTHAGRSTPVAPTSV